MRIKLRAILLALTVLASFLGIQTVDAPKAEAYVTHQWRGEFRSASYCYDIQVTRHDNFVLELNVHTFTYGCGQYIRHEVHAETYDFVCFESKLVSGFIWIVPWDNPWDALPGVVCSGSVNGPPSGYQAAADFCQTSNVATSGSGFIGWDPNAGSWSCRFNFWTGNLAYGPNAPLGNYYGWSAHQQFYLV